MMVPSSTANRLAVSKRCKLLHDGLTTRICCRRLIRLVTRMRRGSQPYPTNWIVSDLSQLIHHSCYSGYYLPVDLERVVYVEPGFLGGGFPVKNSVGSSIRLLSELKQLSRILEVEGDYQWDEGDPLTAVKAPFSQLYVITRISCEKNLPIVFYG